MNTSVTTADRNARRRLAVGLLGKGWTLTEIAEALDVSVSSVKRWKKVFQQGGEAALAVKWSKGPTCRLTDAQRERLRQIIIDGPCAAGFSTELWTCPRVVEVIRREFGVSYHPDHVGKILHAMGFTPQKPQRRARERDEAAIEAWRKKDWPRIKKRGAAAKLPSFLSMKAALFCNL
jgi:transposase